MVWKRLRKKKAKKIDQLIDLTERLLPWLQEQGIGYSHIARGYDEEHKR